MSNLRSKGTISKRHQVVYQGHQVYEWEQDIDEIHCYIIPPSGLQANSIQCAITAEHITLGIKGNPPFIDEQLGGVCKASESYWTLEDNVIHITLSKAIVGTVWTCFTTGHPSLEPNINALTVTQLENEQQAILLQRMQREHPTFDFSNAAVHGQIPNPTNFMDGMKRT